MANNVFGGYRGSSSGAMVAQQFQNARAGEIMAQGISQAGQSIAEGIRQNKELSREAKALRQMLKIYDPDNADVVDTEDIGKLRGRSMAIVEKQRRAEHEQRMQAAAMQMEQMQSQMDARKRQEQGMRDLDPRMRAAQQIGQGYAGGGLRGAMGAAHAAGDPANQRHASAAQIMAKAMEVGSPELYKLGLEAQGAEAKGQNWGLKPGQMIDMGNGMRMVATSANQFQVVNMNEKADTSGWPPGTTIKPADPEDPEKGFVAVAPDGSVLAWKLKTEHPFAPVVRDIVDKGKEKAKAGAGPSGAPGSWDDFQTWQKNRK